ncbi:MAG: hypothetical protein HGB35_07065 [Geobacteraceae bacterium]|nr:hypothetical protein [Geobacteraceae bacterium]
MDGDGDLDLFAQARFGGILNYYENVGSKTQAVFVLSDSGYLGLLNGDIHLAFFDMDADNDYDLFEGTTAGDINYYENIGATNAAAWALPQTNIFNYEGDDTLYATVPSLCDIDNDDDFDFFMGSYYGGLICFENIGTPATASWAPHSEAMSPLGLDAGSQSAPVFCDLDGDQDQDMLCGVRAGNIACYKKGTIFIMIRIFGLRLLAISEIH